VVNNNTGWLLFGRCAAKLVVGAYRRCAVSTGTKLVAVSLLLFSVKNLCLVSCAI
jgi:hypothetical protein